MAAGDYTGREKVSLLNGRALWQHITGGGAQAIRAAMGLGDTLGPLQPECGGTGSVMHENLEDYVSNKILVAISSSLSIPTANSAGSLTSVGEVSPVNTDSKFYNSYFEWDRSYGEVVFKVPGTYRFNFGLAEMRWYSGNGTFTDAKISLNIAKGSKNYSGGSRILQVKANKAPSLNDKNETSIYNSMFSINVSGSNQTYTMYARADSYNTGNQYDIYLLLKNIVVICDA